MVNKWTVYAATYASYSVVHAVRTCWASLKTVLTDEPFEFSQKFLGILDMVVLFTIAVLVTIFGGQVHKYSRRRLLFAMMVGLTLNLIVLFVLLLKLVTIPALYVVFYSTVGVISCLAWPICLYTTSQYFQSRDATALSMWSSVSQCGDLIALIITLFVSFDADASKASFSMLALAILFIVVMVFDFFFFRDKENEEENRSAVHRNPSSNQVLSAQQQIKNEPADAENVAPTDPTPEPRKDEIVSENSDSAATDSATTAPEATPKPVNFLTVWLLPGVALPVLAFSSVKSINAIIISWLVLYFTKLGMVKQSRIIAIVWTCSIVVGGFIGSKINSQLSYRIFMVCLFIAGSTFYLLEQLHLGPGQFEVIALIIVIALLVGGPYNQLGTAVPLKLCEQPSIKSVPKAKSTLISVMQGFAIMICGIAVIIVPGIGIIRLHLMAGALCYLSFVLLLGEQIRRYLRRKQMPLQRSRVQEKIQPGPAPVQAGNKEQLPGDAVEMKQQF